MQNDRDSLTKHELTDNKHNRGFSSFFYKSIIWGIITYFLGKEFANNHFGFVVLAVYLFSIPIALSGIYSNTINQIRRLHDLTRHGLIFRLLSARLLKVIIWACWALVTSFFMLMQFHTYSNMEWIAFFLVIPVFWVIFYISHRMIVTEYKSYVATSIAMIWSCWASSLVMLAIYVALIAHLGDIPIYSSISEAIDVQKKVVAEMAGSESALVSEFAKYLAVYNGFKAYFLGNLSFQSAPSALLVFGLGGFVVFYNACAILSCFLIPVEEYRRVFGPLSDIDHPKHILPSRIAFIGAVTTFLTLFIYLPMMVYIETRIRQTPEIARAREQIEARIVKCEQLDNECFKEGTKEKLQAAYNDAVRKIDPFYANLENKIDSAFKKMEDNVDSYLDNYYSLTGEYARIGHLLIGEIEEYTTKQVEESLQKGDVFKEVQIALDETLAAHSALETELQQNLETIKNQNRVNPAEYKIQVVKRLSLPHGFKMPIHPDIIKLQNRLTGSVVAGAATGIVVAKITGKIASKGIFKLAAKALVKVGLSKATGIGGGAGAGAATGAALGSFAPGIGTAIGAAAGGIIGGIAAGLAVDKATLLLEEYYGRETYKNEILSAIREEKMAFKQQGEPTPEQSTYKPGDRLPDGSIVFFVDASGEHGLAAKPTDSSAGATWDDAMQLANALGTGWHLPSKQELNLLYEQQSVVGGFASKLYWSSTENDSSTAWSQDFNDGLKYGIVNLGTLPVRAIRSF